jgi:hypothetical protein
MERRIAAESLDDIGQKLHLKTQPVGNATLQYVRYLNIEISRTTAPKLSADNDDVVGQRYIRMDTLEPPSNLRHLFLAAPKQRDGSMHRLGTDHDRPSPFVPRCAGPHACPYGRRYPGKVALSVDPLKRAPLARVEFPWSEESMVAYLHSTWLR